MLWETRPTRPTEGRDNVEWLLQQDSCACAQFFVNLYGPRFLGAGCDPLFVDTIVGGFFAFFFILCERSVCVYNTGRGRSFVETTEHISK